MWALGARLKTRERERNQHATLGIIILKCILKQQGVGVLSGIKWLRIKSSVAGPCEQGNEASVTTQGGAYCPPTRRKSVRGWAALVRCEGVLTLGWNKKKVKFSLEQATKAQRGSRGIALLFL